MTPEKMLETIRSYRAMFEEGGFRKIEHPANTPTRSEPRVVEHCHHMLDVIERDIRERRNALAIKRLAFVQGALFALRIFSLKEIEGHNRVPKTMSPPG